MLLLALLLGQVILVKNAQPVIAMPAGIAHSPINLLGAVVNESMVRHMRHSTFNPWMQTQAIQQSWTDIEPVARRELQQQAGQAELTIVKSAQQLIDAVDAGALHIEIRDHLDLTTATPRDTNSSWGSCNSEPSAADLGLAGTISLDWTPGQCVIVTDLDLMTIYQNLWMHGLYIRHHRTKRTDPSQLMIFSVVRGAKVWLTDVTIQGESIQDPEYGSMLVAGAQLYAEGVSIIDFTSENSALFISDGATVLLNASVISRNTVSYTWPNSGVISVNSINPDIFGDQLADTIVRLRNCNLEGNDAVHDLIATTDGAIYREMNVSVYSDETRNLFWNLPDPSMSTTLPLSLAPVDRPGIDASTDWFVNLKETLIELETAAAPAPTPTPTPETSDSAPTPSSKPVEPPSQQFPVAAAASPLGITEPRSGGTAVSDDPTNSNNTPSTEPSEELETGSPGQGGGGGGGGGSGVSTEAIVGGVAAVAAVCLAAVFAAIVFKRRKAARKGQAEHKKQEGVHGDRELPKLPHTAARMDASQARNEKQSGSGDTTTEAMASAAEHGQQMVHYLSLTSASQPTSSTTHTHSTTSTKPGFVSTVPPLARPLHNGAQYSATESAMITRLNVPNVQERASHAPKKPQVKAQGPVNAPQVGAPVTVDTFDLTHSVPVKVLLQPPGPNASSEEKMDFLQQQLDSFGRDRPVVGNLISLGGNGSERRQGGQAVVQMAVQMATMEQYAIKFFLSMAAFKEERGLYRQGSDMKAGPFSNFLPKVLQVHTNHDGQLKDAHGHPLPPCIVMERGESLDLWAARRHPDRTMAFAMMHQLASRLKELHALRYIHRDLKPGNVMWLPRENRWTIIDFGCVARTGEEARLGFTLGYAAPEVVHAYRRSDRTMVAKEAVDVWSLGVMAFELLTGRPALSMLEGKDRVMDRIEGLNGLTLPWEGTLPPGVRRQLGIFKDSVLHLLARNPDHRPSMAQFCVSCDRVLAGSTSVQV